MRWFLALVALSAGCTSRLLIGLPADITQTDSIVGMGTQGRSDVLFMVDNSPSMDAMQAELRARFPQLIKTLSGLNQGGSLDLHIGVVTSDYGAGDTAGGGCEASPGGQKGLLQTVGAAADATCLPPLNAPYISYQVDALGNVTSNLPSGQDVATTFTCMASVGAGGCGFEHQLESVYAALHNTNENSGFLRDDAALAVVFVTNEDDGSAPPDAKFYESAADVSVFGAYDTFRQTRFAIECSDKLPPYGNDAVGTLSNCVGAPQNVGLAYDISRYINMFTQPISGGGIKDDPSQIALLAIAAPATPVTLVLVTSGTGLGVPPNPTYVPCGAIGTGCVERLEHSCQNSVDPAFFGDPAVRIDSVVNAATVHQLWSICGDTEDQAPDFTQAMEGVGSEMALQAAGGCLPAALVTPDTPSCNITIGDDPAVVSYCDAANTPPCWHIERDPTCPARTDPNTGFADTYRLVITGSASVTGAVHAKCLTYQMAM